MRSQPHCSRSFWNCTFASRPSRRPQRPCPYLKGSEPLPEMFIATRGLSTRATGLYAHASWHQMAKLACTSLTRLAPDLLPAGKDNYDPAPNLYSTNTATKEVERYA